MVEYCKENLLSLRDLLSAIPNESYAQKLEILSLNSIGDHIRHVLEMYDCLICGIIREEVDYESRKRNQDLANNKNIAIENIDHIVSNLTGLCNNKVITLKGSFSCNSDSTINIISSVYRELAYNLEHSIHHQAIIKIGLKELNLMALIDSNFGLAPSTIKFLKSNISV